MKAGLRAAILVGATASVAALSAAPAAATPVATSDAEYGTLGRVFPDPLAGCTSSPCSPNAQGTFPAIQFIQIQEFLDAVQFMNQKPEWQRYMEVQVLDGELGANGPGEGPPDGALAAGDPGEEVFAGNNLPLEYDPKPEFRSAGLPTNTLDRNRSDLIVVRVTDESVPDAGKERYALSLSIHGIERAGLEGGTRAMEDLVTAFTTGKDDEPVVPEEAGLDAPAPTFAEVLEKSIVYFTYPNPDGWRRGSISEGGFFFQRYNGNGVDLNRDWPDIGFSFRPYSGLSEPESRALAAYMDDVKSSTGDEFAAGDDLHGQPFADALSYTLLPHGRHDFDKDQRIRNTATAIHRASEAALLWSPAIQPNEAPPPECVPEVPEVGSPVGDMCFPIYGQTWGTVYDTINYTTTGALGDYFDSSVGLGADGIDNEMSFSHIDKNINFDPHTEQLHVDGNKALIYAHLAELLNPVSYRFEPAGTQGYVPNTRLTRDEKVFEAGPLPGTVAQADINGQVGTIDPGEGTIKFPFTVKRGPQPADGSPDAGNNVFNGGMRVDVTTQNLQGVGSGIAHLAIQCRGCDEHPGVEPEDPDIPDDEEWITVTEDFNQSPLYAQSGVTAAVNRPQAFKTAGGSDPVDWRAVLSGDIVGVITTPSPALVSTMNVDFTQGRATTDGATGGDEPPRLAGYDIANTDFFGELNGFIDDPAERFEAIDPRAVIEGTQLLAELDSLVLADHALPGYTGSLDAGTAPGGGPTADFNFQSQEQTAPGFSSGAPGTFEEFEFDIASNEANSKLTVRIEWASADNDFDLFLYREETNGDRTLVDDSAQGGTTFEQIVVDDPAAGHYIIRVDNWLATDPAFTGSVTFEPLAPGEEGGTGAYTVAEKNAWLAALEEYVRGGGNLVLTDGALQVLPGLTDVPASEISRQTVYVGQTTFATGPGSGEDTLDDPLAEDVACPPPPEPPTADCPEGARFNTGMRRQTFEPTPLGFSIQNQETGGDESHARQYDIGIDAWEAAGGRTAGTSADSGERDALPVFDRVTLGELPLGSGQIRIAGALLPQPSQEFDHTLGLEPFATTYTGYILICNLVDCTVRIAEAPGGGEPEPEPEPGAGAGPGAGPGTGPGPGGECANVIRGNRGNNKLVGTPGSDRISGRRGNDRIKGRGSGDCLRGGRGKDKIRGGNGDDRIHVAAGRRDRVNCGPGKDTVNAGRKDRVHKSCERIR